MKASAKRALSLLVSCVLLVGSLVIYAAFIRPAYADVAMLRGQLVAKQDLFDGKRAAVDKVKALIMQYQGAGKLQDVISYSLPTDEQVSSVFNQLQAIASANDLSVEVFNVQPLSFKPSSSRGEDGTDTASLVRPVGTLRVSLRLSGPYAAFKEFVRGLETNIRVMDLVSMKVEQAGGKGGDMFSYTVVADTYYQGK